MGTYNPTRRNRNIGTAARGHGKNNRLVIPRPRNDRIYYESLTSFEIEVHTVHGQSVSFIRESLQDNWRHSCSISEVLRVLDGVPASDLESLNCILFRQPTRKQMIVSPTWGRLTYYATVGVPGERDVYAGPLITLEACCDSQILKWSKSLNLESQKELQRLRDDGHIVEERSRHFLISTSEQTARNTQLYRTLPHEIGHWVDYLEKVERPSKLRPGSWSELDARYFSRPSSEREAFAHRYADTLRRDLEIRELIPFEPQ
jgi:hypothetical protein